MSLKPVLACSLAALVLGAAASRLGADTAPIPQVLASGAAPDPGAESNPEAAGLLKLGEDLAKKGDYTTSEIAFRQVLDRTDFTAADQKTALLGLAHMYRQAGMLAHQAGALT